MHDRFSSRVLANIKRSRKINYGANNRNLPFSETMICLVEGKLIFFNELLD